MPAFGENTDLSQHPPKNLTAQAVAPLTEHVPSSCPYDLVSLEMKDPHHSAVINRKVKLTQWFSL